MKLKLSTSLLFLMFVFSITSCKNEKKEQVGPDGQEANDIELLADVKYQCPMDCEDGRTYHEPGSCPICKMESVNAKETNVHAPIVQNIIDS